MRNAFKVGMLSAGILLIGSSAHAADNWSTFANSGFGNGNQVKIPVQLPVEICGNAVGVGGAASAWCQGGAEAVMGAGPVLNWTTYGNSGLLNGNQVDVPVQAPIDVCGNAVSVLGSATAGCAGGSSAVIGGEPHSNPPHAYDRGAAKPAHHGAAKPAHHKKKKHTEVLGLEGLLGALTGGATAQTLPAASARYLGPGGGSCDLNWTTFGNTGLLNGNQVYVPVQAAVDVSGNAVGVLGDANASSMGGSSVKYC